MAFPCHFGTTYATCLAPFGVELMLSRFLAVLSDGAEASWKAGALGQYGSVQCVGPSGPACGGGDLR